ncbi:hypothetical protein TRFO_10838 [Tritrichomonas foetus]|uniref:Raptor N-terminal CASPase-like domain-containing protein n=1 Tax=Tritrichomonas foetus TaxID=1144522 RepID=A0A1J4J6N2_9EUKA|nr:hypothetical protein TRFO_10838 [Tritrichomonas foetus]|eukprot:OHS94894.1 hypothetical protein TRFO_10838 [Tritrichomonas foetus]
MSDFANPKTNREAPRRVSRNTTSIARPARPVLGNQAPIAKTKTVVSFLCLFDGLRTPSIRRLVRKPRTICNNPLLTYDPSFYAPSSTKALSDLYMTSINCSCEIAVDPSVQTVLELLRKHATSIPPHRVLLHYFGHGCYEPTESNLYFFSDDRLRYKPFKISNLLHSCACPIVIVLDCPKAAILSKMLATKRDTFAFFACAANEKLPSSTSAPLDIFSSCLFQPFTIAMWYHQQNNCNIFSREMKDSQLKNIKFLKMFLNAILESICFDSQDSATFEMFTRDPAIGVMFRGFALAQRVMMMYNLHPSTLPELKPMMTNVLWKYWDLAIDTCATLPEQTAKEVVFQLFLKTFMTYPKIGHLPLFSFFMKIPEVHEENAYQLFTFMDSAPDFAEAATRTDLPKAIISVELPSAVSLTILAKLMAISGTSPFLSTSPTYFAVSDDPSVVAAGMIALTVASHLSWQPAFKKLAGLCIDHANECAPFSLLLFGTIMDKSSGTAYIDDFSSNITSLLEDSRDDIRASAVYALSCSKNPVVVEYFSKMIDDRSPVVRLQVLYALLMTYQLIKDQGIFDLIDKLSKDSSTDVRNHFNILKPNFMRVKSGMNSNQISASNPIIPHLIESLKAVNFEQRFDSNVFNIKFPKIEGKSASTLENKMPRIGAFSFGKPA